MPILTIDPGARWGLAYGDSTPTICVGRGIDAFTAAIDQIDPSVPVHLEEPFQQIVGVCGHQSGVQQLRTYCQIRDSLVRRFRVIHHLPVLTWQSIHKPYLSIRDPKERSLAVVQAKGWTGPWQAKGGKRDGEACDAAAMFAYVLGGSK